MNATRNVVMDLWPLYAAGDASQDSRVLVEEFLTQDPRFAQALQDDTSDEILKPPVVALPRDHEYATLVRLQRRRAIQSMTVNTVALFISAVMTTLFLWKVVPGWVRMFEGAAMALPAPTRFIIATSNLLLPLAVPTAAVIGLLYVFRNHIRVPEIVKSGTGMAIVTGLALLVTQLGWLAFMVDTESVVGEAYKVAAPATRLNKATLAMRSGDYAAAVEHLQVAIQRLAESGAPDPPLIVSSYALLGDAYAKLGDTERARMSYLQALQHLRNARAIGSELHIAELEKAIQASLDSQQ
jgi:hypothetical protein